MFKWGKRSKKVVSYEPKTPRLTSVALPDGQYSPMIIQASYTHTPPVNLLLQSMTPDHRGTAPMYDSRHYHHSRSRTISTPVRHVEAPRPIRPHPSQGPFIPVMDEPNWIRFEPPRAPISVPSAQYLEEQIRNNLVDPSIQRMLHGPEYEYPEERNLKNAAKKAGVYIQRTASKAYLDEIEEQKRQLSRGPSAPPLKKGSAKDVVGFEDWKPVPIATTPPKQPVIEPEQKGLLKSALRKIPSTKATPRTRAVKSALKGGQETAYYSENEASRRKLDILKPIRVTTVPSKAWLEEQRERQEREQREKEQELKRGWSSHSQSHQARPVYGPAAFGHSSNSSATPSPADEHGVSVNRDSRSFRNELRSRRAGQQGSGSSYLPAYIKDDEYQQAYQELLEWETNPPIHGRLSWPLVEYDKRRRDSEPLIYFDAGFNPRIPRFAVKAKRGPVHEPLTREEEVMSVSTNAGMMSMTIICSKLPKWPIYLKRSDILRVIDVFRAIYDTYSQPLTHQELREMGEEYIERCRRAFLQRCHDSPEFDHIEERKGMLRIDLLRGRRIFKGLVPVPGQAWTYELLFDEGR